MIRQHLPIVLEGPRPEHSGMSISPAQLEGLHWRDGRRYELIRGTLAVSPAPDPTHNDLVDRIARALAAYCDPNGRPVFAKVSQRARVIVADEEQLLTNPEPDLAAYLTYPAIPAKSYRDLHPALVVEVVSLGSQEKDYIRNRELYWLAPSIIEYWIVDPTVDALRPTMTVHVRMAGATCFERNDIQPGGRYESATWSGLRFVLDWMHVD